MSHISPSKLPTWKTCQSLESTPCQWMLVSLASPSHPRHTCSTGIHPLYELWRSPQYYMLFPTTHFRISRISICRSPRDQNIHRSQFTSTLSAISSAYYQRPRWFNSWASSKCTTPPPFKIRLLIPDCTSLICGISQLGNPTGNTRITCSGT